HHQATRSRGGGEHRERSQVHRVQDRLSRALSRQRDIQACERSAEARRRFRSGRRRDRQAFSRLIGLSRTMSHPNNKLGGPLVLVSLDGLGERETTPDNAITNARAPRYAELRATYPWTTIGTSGPDVGLPPGQMGNSEVGHLNFGAGRIAQMDISRIDCEVA